MITDYGQRIIELNKLTKRELNILAGKKCGIHESAITKSQLRRTKRSLVLSVLRMEHLDYYEDGMLLLVKQADASTGWVHK